MQPPRKIVINMETQKEKMMEARDAYSFSFALLHFYIRAPMQTPYTFVYNVHKLFNESSRNLFLLVFPDQHFPQLPDLNEEEAERGKSLVAGWFPD